MEESEMVVWSSMGQIVNQSQGTVLNNLLVVRRYDQQTNFLGPDLLTLPTGFARYSLHADVQQQLA